MSESGFDGHDFAVDANSMRNKDWVERVTYTPVLPCVTFLSGSFLPSLTRVFIALGRFQSRVIVSQF